MMAGCRICESGSSEAFDFIPPASHVGRPSVERNSGFSFQMMDEFSGIGQIFPYGGKKGRATNAGLENEPIDPRAQLTNEVILACANDRRRRREDRNAQVNFRKFFCIQGRETRVFKGGREGISMDVFCERANSFKASNTAAQLAFFFEGHKSSPFFAQARRFQVDCEGGGDPCFQTAPHAFPSDLPEPLFGCIIQLHRRRTLRRGSDRRQYRQNFERPKL